MNKPCKYEHVLATAVAVLVVCFLSAICSAAPSPTTRPQLTNLSLSGFVGFSEKNSAARSGSHIPFYVELKTQGEPFDGEIVVRSAKADPSLAWEPRFVAPVKVGINTIKGFSDVFRIPPNTDSLVAELWVKKKKVAETHMALSPIPPHRQAILVLTDQENTLNHLAMADDPLPARKRTLIYGQVRHLPRHSLGYEALQAVVIDQASLVDLSEEQTAALEAWVKSGGILIAATGAGWQRIDQSPLARMLPVTMRRSVEVESPFPRDADVPATQTLPNALIAESVLREPDAILDMLWQDERTGNPLVVRQALGHGFVAFLSFTLTDQQVAQSNWLNELMLALLSATGEKSSSVTPRREAAERVESILQEKSLLPVPSAETVGYWMLAYLLLFLPAIFVAAWFWRGAAIAWIALPVAFVGATIYLMQSGAYESSGQREFVQLGFCDVAPNGGNGAGEAFVSLYSTSADRVQLLSWSPWTLIQPLQQSPFPGQPPQAFRYSSSVQMASAAVEEFEIPPRAARSFGILFSPESQQPPVDSFATFKRISQQADKNSFTWNVIGESLQVRITNNTGLLLRDAAIIGLSRAIPMGEVELGQQFELTIDPGKGMPFDQWLMQAARPATAREMNASVDLAQQGRSLLATLALDPYKAALVGWSEVNPVSYEARSLNGFPSVTSGNKTGALWHAIRVAAPAVGEIHLEMQDFEITPWTQKEEVFDWASHSTFLADRTNAQFEIDDQWTLRMKPRMLFHSESQKQWPLQSAWGSLGDNWPHRMEFFNFQSNQWVPAPKPIQGRRIIAAADNLVNAATGEIWIRMSGDTFELSQTQLDLKMNYQTWP